MVINLIVSVILFLWIFVGLFFTTIISKAFQAYELGPMNGDLFAFMCFVVWSLPMLIISHWHSVKQQKRLNYVAKWF